MPVFRGYGGPQTGTTGADLWAVTKAELRRQRREFYRGFAPKSWPKEEERDSPSKTNPLIVSTDAYAVDMAGPGTPAAIPSPLLPVDDASPPSGTSPESWPPDSSGAPNVDDVVSRTRAPWADRNRPPQRRTVVIPCRVCGHLFETTRGDARFCSGTCQKQDYRARRKQVQQRR